jgi:hypothetical protein
MKYSQDVGITGMVIYPLCLVTEKWGEEKRERNGTKGGELCIQEK